MPPARPLTSLACSPLLSSPPALSKPLSTRMAFHHPSCNSCSQEKRRSPPPEDTANSTLPTGAFSGLLWLAAVLATSPFAPSGNCHPTAFSSVLLVGRFSLHWVGVPGDQSTGKRRGGTPDSGSWAHLLLIPSSRMQPWPLGAPPCPLTQ